MTTRPSETSNLPFDAPLLPAFSVTRTDTICLVLVLVCLAGFFPLRSSTDLVLPTPLKAATVEGQSIATFADPLLRGDESPLKRPFSKLVVKSVKGMAAVGVSDGPTGEAEFRANYARYIHKLNVVLLGMVAFAAFFFLKVLFWDRLTAVPASVALLVVVSPWHAGLLPSALLAGELIGLFFTLLTLFFIAVNPVRNPRTLRTFILPIWIFAALAICSTEFALPLILYTFLLDLVHVQRGTSILRLLKKRIWLYLPLSVFSAVWIGLVHLQGEQISPADWPATISHLATLVLQPTNPYDFFAAGRRPETLSAIPGILLIVFTACAGVIALASALFRRAGVLIFCSLASLTATLFIGENGQPFLSYTQLVVPVFFLLAALVTFLSALFHLEQRDENKEPANESTKWNPIYQSALAGLCLLFLLLTALRLWPTTQSRVFYEKAASKYGDQLPELHLLVSKLQLEEALSYKEKERARALAEKSDETLEIALDTYLAVRAEGFEGRIGIPASEFDYQAQVLTAKGESERALPLLEAAVATTGKSPALVRRLITLYIKTDKPEAVGDLLAELDVKSESDATALMQLSNQALQRQQFELSEQILTKVMNEGKKVLSAAQETRAVAGIAMAKVSQGKANEALDYVAKARKLQPDNPLTIALDIDVNAALGNWQTVASLTLDEDDPSTHLPRLRQVMAPLLQVAYAQNNAKRAEELLNTWVDVSDAGKEKAIALMNRGQFYERAKNELKALNDLRNATTEAPELAATWKALSLYYLRGGFARDATEALQRGYELQPDNTELLQVYVAHLQQVGKKNEARGVIQQAIENGDGDPVQNRVMLATLYFQESLFETAAEKLEEAREIEPENRDLAFLLVEAYEETDDYEKGAEILVELIKDAPREAGLYLRLIEVFESNDDLDSAREALKIAFKNVAKKDCLELFLKGAEIALKGRNVAIAERLYVNALELDEDNQKAKEGLELIEDLKRKAKLQQELLKKAKAPTE
jgi:tetratricopeptide (TPR) repeat protein